jgi:hypothetical protein
MLLLIELWKYIWRCLSNTVNTFQIETGDTVCVIKLGTSAAGKRLLLDGARHTQAAGIIVHGMYVLLDGAPTTEEKEYITLKMMNPLLEEK